MTIDERTIDDNEQVLGEVAPDAPEISEEDLSKLLDLTPVEDAEDDNPAPANTDEEKPPEGDPSDQQTRPDDIDERPLIERLDEVDKEVAPEPEDSPRRQLDQFDSVIRQKEQELQNFTGSVELPHGGIYEANGKLVYHMTAPELEAYVQQLDDDGKAQAAVLVTSAVEKYKDAVRKYQAGENELANLRQNRNVVNQQVEWVEVEREMSRRFPELTKEDFTKAGEFIRERMNNPEYIKTTISKADKVQRGLEALKELGVLKRLRDQALANTKNPSAPPDARTRSKKVVSNSTGDLANSVSEVVRGGQSRFNKLSSDAIDKLLGAGLE